MKTIGAKIALMAIAFISCTPAADDLKAFPPAEQGMTRHVIRLPRQENETALKIELIVGKIVKTDAINHYFFSGSVKTENIPGWGYNRYVVRDLGAMGGTLMAVNPDAPRADRLVMLSGETIVRYNSRLPVVVYVPAGVEVRYRIWRADSTFRSAPVE